MNTVIRDEKGWDSAINRVYDILLNIKDDKLKKNYNINGLKIKEWDAVSVFDGGFSSLSWRPLFGNNCRILNRFYKDLAYRSKSSNKIITAETHEMIDQQLRVARVLKYDCAFMSRETKTQAFNYYKKFLKGLWYTPKDRYRMTTKQYHHIMWTPVLTDKILMEKENDSNC